jgi:hypothetical protein
MKTKSICAALAFIFVASETPSLTPAARAGDDAAIDAAAVVDAFIAGIAKKKLANVVKVINPDVVDAVAAKPAEAVRLCRTVADKFLTTIRNDQAQAPAVALRVGKKASADPAAGADGARALVFGRLAVAATSLALGNTVAATEWNEPLATIKPLAAGRPDGEDDLELCAETILYAVDDDAPDEAALRAAADVAAFAHKTFAQSTKLDSLSLKAEVALACGLAYTKPAEGKAALPKVLATLTARGAAVDGDKDLTAAWNSCVTQLKRLGGGTKVEFKFETQKSPNGWFEFDWPKESGWEQETEIDDKDGVLVIHRSRGARSDYILDMTSWRHDTNYHIDEVHSIGGENKAGLAKWRHDELLKLFAKAQKDDKNAKGKLSDKYTAVNGFEIRGTNPDGKELRYRGWCFYPVNQKCTVFLMLTQIGAVKEKDPQLEFVLESLREPGAKYK